MVDGLVQVERRVVEAVDPARIEADLRALVAIPSITGDEERIQAWLADELRGLGLVVRHFDAGVAATATDPAWPGSEMERSTLPVVVGRLGSGAFHEGSERRVILSGHVDVVPPGDATTWTAGPFEPVMRDGRLVGRGACDMKGGVTAILGAVRALVASGVALDGELLVAFVPSEEDGGQGTLAAIRAGCTGDAAIITEPTALRIVVAHAGAMTFRLTVPGRAAHASKRLEGVSALDKLMVLVRALEEDEVTRNASETHPLMTPLGLPYPTVIGKVRGGDWASTVIDRLVVEGRYGVRLGQTAAQAGEELRAVIAAAAATDPWLLEHPPVLELTGGCFDSAEVPADHPLPAGLAEAASAILGREPERVGEPYGADMRLFVRHGDTPAVLFGPGSVLEAHAADESVPLDEVVDCARILALWVVRELATR